MQVTKYPSVTPLRRSFPVPSPPPDLSTGLRLFFKAYALGFGIAMVSSPL
jgi:hypothetical protein